MNTETKLFWVTILLLLAVMGLNSDAQCGPRKTPKLVAISIKREQLRRANKDPNMNQFQTKTFHIIKMKDLP